MMMKVGIRRYHTGAIAAEMDSVMSPARHPERQMISTETIFATVIFPTSNVADTDARPKSHSRVTAIVKLRDSCSYRCTVVANTWPAVASTDNVTFALRLPAVTVTKRTSPMPTSSSTMSIGSWAFAGGVLNRRRPANTASAINIRGLVPILHHSLPDRHRFRRNEA